MSNLTFSVWTLIAFVLVTTGIAIGVDRHLDRQEIRAARAALDKNFPALAADHLERPRRRMVRTESHCQLLTNTYFAARMAHRLEWASQACLFNGVEIAEAYIGLAAAKELNGQPQEALAVLGAVVERFREIPDIFYRMAQILARLNNPESAAVAYTQALQRAPDNGMILLEALEFMASQKLWSQARPLADRLKSINTNNLNLKLLVARVLLNSGDADGSRLLVQSVTRDLSQSPNRSQLEAAYADLLKAPLEDIKK